MRFLSPRWCEVGAQRDLGSHQPCACFSNISAHTHTRTPTRNQAAALKELQGKYEAKAQDLQVQAQVIKRKYV